MRLAAIFSLTIAIIYILLQGIHGSFYPHLYVDVFVFHARSLYFWEHLNLTNLGHNEYQPGAIIFFILLGAPAFLIDNTVETFKSVLFAGNTLLIILTAVLFHKMQKTAGIILLSILLVFLGPILLFRFDLLVIFLLTLTFYLWEQGDKENLSGKVHFWEKGKFEIAMGVLAFSVLTKVYPIIFLPYLLWLTLKKRRFLDSVSLFLVFIASTLALFLLYTFIFQISFKDTLVSYNFHNLKSIATESIWASAIYFWHILQGNLLPGFESDYGINAIARNDVYPSIAFYNYFWIIPLGILNLVYFLKKKVAHRLDYKFIALNLLIFLIFSKVLSNQYLGWFLFLIPLIDFKDLLKRRWIINLFLIVLTTLLHTFIYPLNYTEWLEVLKRQQPDLILMSIMLISSLLLVVLAVRITVDVFKKHSEPH